MKIKVKEKTYEEVMALEPHKNRRPEPQGRFWRFVLKAASAKDLKKTRFESRRIGMEKLSENEPALYLMNHSSFIDLEIASTIIYPRPFHVVCTLDGFVGKEWLMRKIGCIPTRKFMADMALVRDMIHTVSNLKESVLLYPEASYTFDGTATPLPASLGKCVKLLKVPVVMIRTYGAFARDPLYNGLKLRDVNISADMEYILSADDIANMSADDINKVLADHFSFDNFRWQKENGVEIGEDFRADGLERVLYKCPCCMAEGATEGSGDRLVCRSCGKEYELTPYGEMKALNGETEFPHIPDWYAWERAGVRKELEEGSYETEYDVDIIALVDTDAVYRIGEGVLKHGTDGFHLTGCGGALDYRQDPMSSYSLYADYFWYEIGDMISIGTPRIQYYCFPKVKGANVAKARLATEELYKIRLSNRKKTAPGTEKPAARD